MPDKIIRHNKIPTASNGGFECVIEDKEGNRYRAYMTKREFEIRMLEQKFEELGYNTNLIQEYKDLIEEQTSDQCEEDFSDRDI